MANNNAQIKADHLKAARMARIAGWGGALLILGLAAALSYMAKGRVLPLVMLLSAFTAGFHYLGCAIFTRHFKAQADAIDLGASDE